MQVQASDKQNECLDHLSLLETLEFNLPQILGQIVKDHSCYKLLSRKGFCTLQWLGRTPN